VRRGSRLPTEVATLSGPERKEKGSIRLGQQAESQERKKGERKKLFFFFSGFPKQISK
jgi:hypothetical protein